MDFAAFEQSQRGGSDRLDQLHLHARIALGILVQECRKNRFDLHRGAATFNTPVSPRRSSCACSPSEVTEPSRLRQLPSSCSPAPGQEKAATNAIEKGQAEFPLKVADLPRKSRLGNVQVQRRLGDRAQLGHGDECSQTPEIHALVYAEPA